MSNYPPPTYQQPQYQQGYQQPPNAQGYNYQGYEQIAGYSPPPQGYYQQQPQYQQQYQLQPPQPPQPPSQDTPAGQYPNPMGPFADVGPLRDFWCGLLWFGATVMVFALGGYNLATDNIYRGSDGTIAWNLFEGQGCTNPRFNVSLESDGKCRQLEGPVAGWAAASCDDESTYLSQVFPSEEECKDVILTFRDLKGASGTVKVATPDFVRTCVGNLTSYKQFAPEFASLSGISSDCSRTSEALSSTAVKFLAAGLGVSIAFSLATLVLFRVNAYRCIIVSNVVAGVLFLGAAVLFMSSGIVFPAVIFLLLGLLTFAILYLFRNRIPFAAVCVQCASTVVLNYWGVIVNAFIWMVIQTAFAVFWLYSIGADDAQVALTVPVFVLFILLFYWGMEVYKNIVHVTMSGVTADWFFSLGGPGTPAGYGPDRTRGSPTPSACFRAAVLSLGSICFGSLIVAIISTIRAIANALRDDNSVLGCMLVCILQCIENLMQYFNDYAYVQIAIYGKSYLTAAKDTWALVKSGVGWDAIVNDALIDSIFFIFILGGGLLVGFVLFFLAELDWVWFLVGLIEGFVIISIVMKLVYSGVLTVFIAFWQLRSSGVLWVPPPLNSAPTEELKSKLAAGYQG